MWRDLVVLARPRLGAVGLFVVCMSYVIALPPRPEAAFVGYLVCGSALALAGASVLNQVAECDADARMRRTADRPLPSGRLPVATAAAYGLGLSVAGIAVLLAGVNRAAASWATVGLVLYVGLYTPLKVRTPLATLVGALPGAVPALIGWAAARGPIGAEGWTLFAIVYLWQLPHFLAIGWIHRADYRRAGFRVLPVDDPDGTITARQVVLSALVLLPVSLAPSAVGLGGGIYLAGAVALGTIYLGAGIALAVRRTGTAASRLLRLSVFYLPLLFSLLAWDRFAFR
jgi:heme o synthase